MLLTLFVILLALMGALIAGLVIYLPLSLIRLLHLPQWLTLGIILVLAAWLLGED